MHTTCAHMSHTRCMSRRVVSCLVVSCKGTGCCRLLRVLDFHDNRAGDAGVAALGRALATRCYRGSSAVEAAEAAASAAAASATPPPPPGEAVEQQQEEEEEEEHFYPCSSLVSIFMSGSSAGKVLVHTLYEHTVSGWVGGQDICARTHTLSLRSIQ
jgi:hypothetical protein